MSSPNFSRAASAIDGSATNDAGLGGAASSDEPFPGGSLAKLDELYQQQLRGAAAEIAAAVAHAVGTPLNVISGRAELIRQDPANALAQVTRIEEQVRKMADGLRDFVEYLTSDTRANRDVPAAQVLEHACTLLRPVTAEQQVELLVEDAALAAATVENLASVSVDQRSLSNLVTLLSWALRCTAALHAPGQRKLQLVATPLAGATGGGAVFELHVFGLPLPEHWRIERFEASPPGAESEAFRLVAVCAAIARGQGGKLQADLLPGEHAPAGGVRLRLLCRSSAG